MREHANAELRRLAHGLAPNLAGCSRLLERIARSDDAEILRDLLIERGAEALLDSQEKPGGQASLKEGI